MSVPDVVTVGMPYTETETMDEEDKIAKMIHETYLRELNNGELKESDLYESIPESSGFKRAYKATAREIMKLLKGPVKLGDEIHVPGSEKTFIVVKLTIGIDDVGIGGMEKVKYETSIKY